MKYILILILLNTMIFAISIDNGLSNTEVGFLSVNVSNAGETRNVTITAKIDDSNSTTEIVFDYFTYVTVGERTFRLSSKSNDLHRDKNATVVSSGEFIGEHGNLINWKCISSIEPTSKIFQNKFIFNTNDENETLGSIKLYQYLDEDVYGTANIFFTKGDYCHGNLELFTIQPSNSVGISHGGNYNNGLYNSYFLGWAMDRYNNMKGRIINGQQEVKKDGKLYLTGKTNHPIYGDVYGVWDIVSVLAWSVDENNSQSEITTTLGGVVYSGELNKKRVDLTVGGIVIDYKANNSVSVNARVGNASFIDFNKSTNLTISLIDDNGSIKEEQKIPIDFIQKNNYIDVHLDINSTLFTQKDQIIIFIDKPNIIRELNELNNHITMNIKDIIPFGHIIASANKPTYTNNELSHLQAQIQNLGKLDANLTAQLILEDSDGNIIYTFSKQSLGMLASNETKQISNEWNTTDTLAGEYLLRGLLIDVEGKVVDESTASFSIVHSGLAATLDLRLDRSIYRTSDSVGIDNFVQSMSSNKIIENSSVELEIVDSTQAVVYTQKITLGTLLPQSTREAPDSYGYERLKIGNYSVKATLKGDDNVTYATDSKNFKVHANLSAELKGAVTVAWRQEHIGATQQCSYAVTNLGSTKLNNLDLQLRVIDMNNSMVMYESNTSRDIESLETMEASKNVLTTGYTPREYSCGLYAQYSTEWILLDHKLFTLTNTMPHAQEQNLSTIEDTSLDIQLHGSDGDGDTLHYSITSEPVHGTLSGSAPNMHYMPNLNYVGSDSFTFKVNDGIVDSVWATVQIVVRKDTHIPEAKDDKKQVTHGQAIIINVLQNDNIAKSDVNLSTMRLMGKEDNLATQVDVDNQGRWKVKVNGDIVFAPINGYVGDPTPIAYSVEDYKGNTLTATIYLNYPPVAYDDHATTLMGKSVEIMVLDNDRATSSTLDNESIRFIEEKHESIELVSVDKGEWVVNTDRGSVVFTPEELYTGEAKAKYVVYELGGDKSNEANITVEVKKNNTIRPTVTPTPTPAVTPTSTVTPCPTKTPCPTITPIPTVTPCPTPKPTPTVTPTPTDNVSNDENISETNDDKPVKPKKDHGNSMNKWGMFFMFILMMLIAQRALKTEERRGN